jgi:hypothetical protein
LGIPLLACRVSFQIYCYSKCLKVVNLKSDIYLDILVHLCVCEREGEGRGEREREKERENFAPCFIIRKLY